MDWENIKKEQYERAMDLAEQGGEPDNVMLLTPSEYASSMSKSFEFPGVEEYDLIKALPEAFPVSLIGLKEILEPYDMSFDSFARTIDHPIKRYLEGSVIALKNALADDLSVDQLNKQFYIYATLYKIVDGALDYYQEEIIAEKEAAKDPGINYLEKKERESDVRAYEIVIAELQSMVNKTQEGINLVSQILADVKDTRS